MLAQRVLSEIGQGRQQLAELANVLERDRNRIVNAVQVLKRRGLVEVVTRGSYRLTEAGQAWLDHGQAVRSGSHAPRLRMAARGQLRQRAWWVIRARKTVTLSGLLASVADGSEKAAESNLGRFLRELARAGVLVVLPRRAPGLANTSNGHLRYQLVRDLGRMVPVMRRRGRELYDPNSGAIFDIGGDA